MDLRALYQTLHERRRPEDVAEMLLSLLQDQLTPYQRLRLEKAAAHSLRRSVWQYTSMRQTFREISGAARQAGKAAELFAVEPPADLRYEEPAEVEAFLRQLGPAIGKEFGHSSYRHDRLNRAARAAQGLDVSRRRYNKLFRALRHLEKKLTTMLAELPKLEMEKVAKHGLAHRLSYAEFSQDPASAAFIAYYTARCNVRSQFTIDGQQRPFDDVAEMLLSRCSRPAPIWPFGRSVADAAAETAPVANWWAIAHVYPDPVVLARLTEEQKGRLLGRWTAVQQELAAFLGEVWRRNTFRRDTMTVKAGDDSSTWNAAAGAWNKARDGWMNLLYALGLEPVLDELCVGKVLRLLAADVVAWHRRAGQGPDPNTQVWNELPLPWEVLAGEARCTRPMVEDACRRAGLDAYKSGWLAPRPHGVVPFRPTPELVHGVSVANPYLATVLKRHGYFSGKSATPLRPQDN